MKIYVSHCTQFSLVEAQRILNRATATTPTYAWTRKNTGCGKHVERQAVVIWDHTHCWILRPEEAREWGNQAPTHTGSRYQAYKLRKAPTLRFIANPAWTLKHIPELVSTTLHAHSAARLAKRLAHRTACKRYRAKKKAELAKTR